MILSATAVATSSFVLFLLLRTAGQWLLVRRKWTTGGLRATLDTFFCDGILRRTSNAPSIEYRASFDRGGKTLFGTEVGCTARYIGA